MAILASVGQVVSYLLSVFFARSFGIEGFEPYVVASAIFIVMVAVAPLGVDKLALRKLPTLLLAKDWSAAIGFLRFGTSRSLASASVIAVIVIVLVWSSETIPSAVSAAIVVSCLSLPGGALAHFGIEVLTAAGQPARATAILRIGVPATALILAAGSVMLFPKPGGWVAVGTWGIAWVLAAILLAKEIRAALPAEVWRAKAADDRRAWSAEAKPFWVYRVVAALAAQSSVILLDVLQPSAQAVGAYAAALATVAPALALATSTNRAYASDLAVLLEKRDRPRLRALHRRRLRWLVPAIAVFLLIALLLPRPVLSLFGPAFVEEGVGALRIMALATSFTMVFALAPTYLKYARQQRMITVVQVAALATQLVLCLLLIPRWGATGAALSTAISSVAMYGAFAIAARRSIVGLDAGAGH